MLVLQCRQSVCTFSSVGHCASTVIEVRAMNKARPQGCTPDANAYLDGKGWINKAPSPHDASPEDAVGYSSHIFVILQKNVIEPLAEVLQLLQDHG